MTARISELDPQAEKLPTLYMVMIIIIGIAFLGTLAAGILWVFTKEGEFAGWLVAIVSATGGGLLGALLPKGTKPVVLIEKDEPTKTVVE